MLSREKLQYNADEKFRENNTRYIVILLWWTNQRDPPRMDQANGSVFGGRKIFVNVMFHLCLSAQLSVVWLVVSNISSSENKKKLVKSMCNFPLNKSFRIDRRIDVLKNAKNKIMFIVTRRLIFNLFYDPGIIQKLKSTRAFAIVHL